MRLKTSRLSAATAAACAAALVLGGTSAALAQGNGSKGPSSTPTDSTTARSTVDKTEAMVVLTEEPLATAVSTRTASGRVALGSPQAREQQRIIADERSAFRSWLRANAPKASVVGSHDLALNAVSVKLNGVSLATLRSAPQVTAAQFQSVYYPLGHEDPQLARIDAVEAWGAAGGDADAGEGVMVGIIDTGIDVGHPCFSDGDPSDDGALTNDKVIVAEVFHNKTNSKGFTPADLNGHGTHVAGTVACNLHTPGAEIDVPDGEDAAIDYAPSGVAPAATLGNYNVFPGPGGSARSEDILNALEAAYTDGMDVVNMSLGGGASGVQDLLTIAVDKLDQAGMISVVAQGNDGPGSFTVGSPGSAERALTVGASSVGHFVGSPVTVAGQEYGAASGDFATVDEDLTATLAVVAGATNGLSTACNGQALGDLTGKIALISRGVCSFSEKIRNAQTAGAVAVLVANNTAGDPSAMGSDGTANQPTVPAYMVALNSGQELRDDNGAEATIGAGVAYISDTGNDDIMAAFSSRGPTDVDWRVKPDVVAPGVNVLSAQPLAFCPGEDSCWAFYQGTSMATPHVAGAAAVVIDAFRTDGRDYTPEDIRSAIVNTAEEGVLTSHLDGTTVVKDYNIVGAGQLDLDSAVGAVLGIGPVSTSFGRVPSGSGQTMTKSVRLTSLTGEDQAVTVTAESLSVGNASGGPATFSVEPATVTVDGEDGAVVQVTVDVPRGARTGDHQGMLRFSVAGTEVAHSPLYVNVK